MPIQKKKIETPLTVDEAVIQLERFCAYQERYVKELRQKLQEFQIPDEDGEVILKYLQEENFVNDARYTDAYVRGKIRSNNWGKHKIKLELKAKDIDERVIDAAMRDFPKGEYQKIINNLVLKKQQEFQKNPPMVQRHKITTYLLRAGWEQNMAIDAINRLFATLGLP